MPRHRVLAGPFRALEPPFLAEVARRLRARPLEPVEVLAGSNLLSVYLRRRAAEELGAVVNLRFVTFLDLAREMAPGADPRPPLPALGAARLARRALVEAPEADVFGGLRERRSIAKALLSTYTDLREAGVPSPWREVLPAGSNLPDRRAFLSSVGATLDRLAALSAPFRDADTLLERAAAEGSAPAREELLVYGLWDLGGTRSRLLSRVAGSRTIAAFVPEEETKGEGEGRGAPLFERLLGVHATRVAPPSEEPAVATVLAPSEGAEAREVVRELLRAVEGGTPLHRCAVLLRHPLRQEPALVAELRLRALPFFRPPGTGFARTPAARAAIAIATLAAEDVPRESFEELIDLLDAVGALPAGVSSTRLSTLLTKAAWFGGAAPLLQRLERLARGMEERLARGGDPDEERARRRARAAREMTASRDFCARLVAALPATGAATWSMHAERLGEAFTRVLGRAARPLGEAVDALAVLDEVEPAPVPFSEAAALLPEALDLVPVPHGRFERDGVALLSLVSARGLLFDEVLVPGLAEGIFPAPPRPDPLLLDSERQALAKETGAPLAPRAGPRHLEGERFLFETARGAARKRLVALSPTRDETDRERLPSAFLRELPGVEGATAEELRDVERAAARGVRRVPLGRLAPDAIALDATEAFRFARFRRRALARSPLAPPPVAAALRRSDARGRPRFTEFEGRLLRKTTLLSLEGRVLSATLLEGLAICPYRTLLTRGLNLGETEDASAPLVPDPRQLGGLAHEVLRGVTAELIAHGRSFTWDPAALAAATESRSREAVDRWAEETGADPPPVLRTQAVRRVARLVKTVLEHERGQRARPSGAEVRFGFPPDERADKEMSREAAVVLEAGERVFLLRGQIDRVDMDQGRALVVDYKFGASDPYATANRKGHLLAKGERLQLPIYALAAKAIGASEVAAEFLFVPPLKPEAVPIRFDAERTEEAVAHLAKAAAILANAVDQGDFLPKPDGMRYKPDNCRLCGVRAVCGGGHRPVLERKWTEDGGSSPLAGLGGIR